MEAGYPRRVVVSGDSGRGVDATSHSDRGIGKYSYSEGAVKNSRLFWGDVASFLVRCFGAIGFYIRWLMHWLVVIVWFRHFFFYSRTDT